MGTGSGIGGRIRPNTWWSGDTWESHHGSYARTWQGYIPVCPTLQALSPPVVEAYLRRGQGPDLQAGQEGPDPLSDQEGCLHQEASGEEQEGQGCQVQADFGREQDPSSCQVLQDQGCPAPHLEVREQHCQHPGGLVVCTANDFQ